MMSSVHPSSANTILGFSLGELTDQLIEEGGCLELLRRAPGSSGTEFQLFVSFREQILERDGNTFSNVETVFTEGTLGPRGLPSYLRSPLQLLGRVEGERGIGLWQTPSLMSISARCTAP